MGKEEETQEQKNARIEAINRELLERANNPQRNFRISKQQLVDVVEAAMGRHFCEEIDLMEKNGGDDWIRKGLLTDFKNGIPGTPQDIDDRTFAFQSNEKPPAHMQSFFEHLIEALDDFTLKILIVAAFASIGIEVGTADSSHRSTAWIEGFAIFVAVLVCSFVTAINNYQKERQFQELNNKADERKVVTVFRGGVNMTIHNSKVLVGDLVTLKEGMEIPADGYVIDASELTCDESAMTGEPDPLRKAPLSACIAKRDEIIADGAKNTSGSHDVPSCVIMSGTKVQDGKGKMIISVVGDSSQVGKIQSLLRSNQDTETPLQIKLEMISEDIGKFGMYSAIAILLVLLIRFTIERTSANKFEGRHVGELLGFFIIAVTVIVVAIPEGLPLAVTLSLAYSVKQMYDDQNLVRKLEACETMGGANNICSDKTGTLTKNIMTLTTWWNVEYQEFKYQDAKMNLNEYAPSAFHELLIHSCGINTSAQLRPDEQGSRTDIALLKALDKFGFAYEALREKFPDPYMVPFSSRRKRMSTIIEINGRKRLYVKGASDWVVACCTHFHNKNTQQIVPMDDNMNNQINASIKRMAENALRTICIAYRDMDGTEDMKTKDDMGVYAFEKSKLTFLAIFGIADVVRPEVPDAVAKCQRAGIKVRMVTGDFRDTAKAIAIKCGIVKPDDPTCLIMEGEDFIRKTGGIVCSRCRTAVCGCPRDKAEAEQKNMEIRIDTIANGEVFDEIYPNLCVLARSQPSHKYALVTGLIERDQVVAVTGDGTNDAPALKKADVGFAMGIAGTEVARDAASIILLDDNFKSIVAAVMWGRNIYDAIKKFLQFQLTVNVVAVLCTLIGAAVVKQEVLKPIQMLWVNLIMDTLASLALATEPPTEELLNRKPHNRYEYIISRKMVKHIIGQALLQITILCIIVFDGEYFLPEWEDTCNNPSKCFDDRLEVINQEINSGARTLVDSTTFNEESDKWPKYLYPVSKVRFHDAEKTKIASGRQRSYSGLYPNYELVDDIFNVPSRHFTYVFNTFVMMTLFNFFNSRMIRDEFNSFEGITQNYLFGLIVCIILAGQILIVTFGNIAFHCYSYYGLRVEQWLITIGFGMTGLIWNLFLKQVDENKVVWFNLGWDELAVKPKDEDEHNGDKKGENNKNEQRQREPEPKYGGAKEGASGNQSNNNLNNGNVGSSGPQKLDLSLSKDGKPRRLEPIATKTPVGVISEDEPGAKTGASSKPPAKKPVDNDQEKHRDEDHQKLNSDPDKVQNPPAKQIDNFMLSDQPIAVGGGQAGPQE